MPGDRPGQIRAEPLHTRRPEPVEHGTVGLSVRGIPRFRGDVEQGLQRERALSQPGVGDVEPGVGDSQPGDPQDI